MEICELNIYTFLFHSVKLQNVEEETHRCWKRDKFKYWSANCHR